MPLKAKPIDKFFEEIILLKPYFYLTVFLQNCQCYICTKKQIYTGGGFMLSEYMWQRFYVTGRIDDYLIYREADGDDADGETDVSPAVML